MIVFFGMNLKFLFYIFISEKWRLLDVVENDYGKVWKILIRGKFVKKV